jgi:oligo-1,6-glucosidase
MALISLHLYFLRVVFSFSAAPRYWVLPAGLSPSGVPWLNNYSQAAPSGQALALQPWRAVVYPYGNSY